MDVAIWQAIVHQRVGTAVWPRPSPAVRGVVNIATVKMAETLYDDYVSAILGAVGKKETTNSELDRLGNVLMPGFYRGAYPRGKQPGPDGTRHVLLVNGMSGPPGDHWHAIYREPGHSDLIRRVNPIVVVVRRGPSTPMAEITEKKKVPYLKLIWVHGSKCQYFHENGWS
eukprot:COSAG01_NODE_1265_length_10990_cov_23.579745_8_plen_170_part_00